MDRPKMISKVLSINDTGENGAHQAGICVPKRPEILSFFPPLDGSLKNPRVDIVFADEAGEWWPFVFIYYNNKFFGGTRDEYRLTGMTRFYREVNAHAGDTLVFSRDDCGQYAVALRRVEHTPSVTVNSEGRTHVRLTASTTWKVVTI